MVDQAKKAQSYEEAQAIYSQHFSKIKQAAAEISKIAEDEQFQQHAAKVGMRMEKIDWKNLIGSLSGEICKDWPIVKKVLDYAKTIGSIPFLSFFAPALAGILAVIGPFVDMIDSQFIPLICAVGGATAGATGGADTGFKTNVEHGVRDAGKKN
jgi:hypothetical protein